MQDTAKNELNELMSKHHGLQVLFETDVNVHTWFQMVYAGKCTVEHALVGIILSTVKEKRQYYQIVKEMKMEGNQK